MKINLNLPFGSAGPDDLSYTDISAGMLSGTLETSSAITSKTVSIRLDPNLLGFLDFTVANSKGKFSRNALIVNLIRSGAEAAWNKMPEDEQKRFYEQLSKQQVDLVGESTLY